MSAGPPTPWRPEVEGLRWSGGRSPLLRISPLGGHSSGVGGWSALDARTPPRVGRIEIAQIWPKSCPAWPISDTKSGRVEQVEGGRPTSVRTTTQLTRTAVVFVYPHCLAVVVISRGGLTVSTTRTHRSACRAHGAWNEQMPSEYRPNQTPPQEPLGASC